MSIEMGRGAAQGGLRKSTFRRAIEAAATKAAQPQESDNRYE